MLDKYKALWVSHSSISDFLQCPRAYYLKNIYKDPKTKHKIQITSPALSLGSAVHEVLESLSSLPTNQRFSQSLLEKFELVWKKYHGKRGGFTNPEQEEDYKKDGLEMLQRVTQHPGPLKKLAVKIKEDLPSYWLSEEDNIILCGKVDWLEYLPEDDSVHVIDFKTSRKEEKSNSLQLPIYHLLVTHTQVRKVTKLSYWYLRFSDELSNKTLPDLQEAHEVVLQVAKKINTAKKLNVFKCPHGEKGCFACRPLEKVLRGEAEFVGVGEYNRDIYILERDKQSRESVLL